MTGLSTLLSYNYKCGQCRPQLLWGPKQNLFWGPPPTQVISAWLLPKQIYCTIQYCNVRLLYQYICGIHIQNQCHLFFNFYFKLTVFPPFGAPEGLMFLVCLCLELPLHAGCELSNSAKEQISQKTKKKSHCLEQKSCFSFIIIMEKGSLFFTKHGTFPGTHFSII